MRASISMIGVDLAQGEDEDDEPAAQDPRPGQGAPDAPGARGGARPPAARPPPRGHDGPPAGTARPRRSANGRKRAVRTSTERSTPRSIEPTASSWPPEELVPTVNTRPGTASGRRRQARHRGARKAPAAQRPAREHDGDDHCERGGTSPVTQPAVALSAAPRRAVQRAAEVEAAPPARLRCCHGRAPACRPRRTRRRPPPRTAMPASGQHEARRQQDAGDDRRRRGRCGPAPRRRRADARRPPRAAVKIGTAAEQEQTREHEQRARHQHEGQRPSRRPVVWRAASTAAGSPSRRRASASRRPEA